MEDTCFTILFWFLPYINMNQPWVYISPLPLESAPPLPNSHHIPLLLVVSEPALSSLSHSASSHWLSILHIAVCVFPRYSLPSSHPLFPLFKLDSLEKVTFLVHVFFNLNEILVRLKIFSIKTKL